MNRSRSRSRTSSVFKDVGICKNLLFESDDEVELGLVRELLESKGIPVFISNEETYRLQRTPHKKGLWICLNEQAPDVACVLKNPSHQVVNPVDVERFYSSIKSMEKRTLRILGLKQDRVPNIVSIAIIGGLIIAALFLILR